MPSKNWRGLTTKLSDHWPTVTLGGKENVKQPETIEAAERASGSLKRMVSLPRGPWVASCQYGMHFILSQDNEILWRCDWLPMPILKAMVDAANRQANSRI